MKIDWYRQFPIITGGPGVEYQQAAQKSILLFVFFQGNERHRASHQTGFLELKKIIKLK